MWHTLIGRKYPFAGTAPGTVTLPVGACVILIVAHAQTSNGTINIFGLVTITVLAIDTAPSSFQFYHTLWQAPNAPNNTIVFGGGINMYFIDSVLQGNV
jgi:hypothetical protein